MPFPFLGWLMFWLPHYLQNYKYHQPCKLKRLLSLTSKYNTSCLIEVQKFFENCHHFFQGQLCFLITKVSFVLLVLFLFCNHLFHFLIAIVCLFLAQFHIHTFVLYFLMIHIYLSLNLFDIGIIQFYFPIHWIVPFIIKIHLSLIIKFIMQILLKIVSYVNLLIPLSITEFDFEAVLLVYSFDHDLLLGYS